MDEVTPRVEKVSYEPAGTFPDQKSELRQAMEDMVRCRDTLNEAITSILQEKRPIKKLESYEDCKFLVAGVKNLHYEICEYIEARVDQIHTNEIRPLIEDSAMLDETFRKEIYHRRSEEDGRGTV